MCAKFYTKHLYMLKTSQDGVELGQVGLGSHLLDGMTRFRLHVNAHHVIVISPNYKKLSARKKHFRRLSAIPPSLSREGTAFNWVMWSSTVSENIMMSSRHTMSSLNRSELTTILICVGTFQVSL